MSTTERCRTPGCPRTAREAYVCTRCATSLTEALTTYPPTDPNHVAPGVSALLADLEVSLARSSRVAAGPGAQSSETPLPFGWSAADALWQLGSTLGAWTRALASERSLTLPLALAELSVWPDGRQRTLTDPTLIAACAWFLVAHEAEVRQLPAAGILIEQVRAAVQSAIQAVDRPPDRTYLLCERCGEDVLADPGATEAECPACGWSHSISRRKEAMLEQVRGYLGTATEVSRLLGTTFGIEVTPARISQWQTRSKIVVRGATPGLAKLYRIGDVIDLASDDPSPPPSHGAPA